MPKRGTVLIDGGTSVVIQGAAHRPPREGELHAARFRAKWYRQVIRHRFDRKPVQCAAHRPPCEGYTNGDAQAKTRYGKAIRHKGSHSRCFSAHLCQNLAKTSPSRLPRPENKARILPRACLNATPVIQEGPKVNPDTLSRLPGMAQGRSWSLPEPPP